MYSENEFVTSEHDDDSTDHDKATDPMDFAAAWPPVARAGIDNDYGTKHMFVVRHYLNPPTYTENEFDTSEHDHDDSTDHYEAEATGLSTTGWPTYPTKSAQHTRWILSTTCWPAYLCIERASNSTGRCGNAARLDGCRCR